MEPSNDTERAIARVIEERCSQGGDCTFPDVLPELIERIDFLFNPKDTLFLINYAKERCPSRPLRKASHSTEDIEGYQAP